MKLTKKDLIQFTKCHVIRKTLDNNTFECNSEISHYGKFIFISMPHPYLAININYPTHKDQKAYLLENNKIVYDAGNFKIIFM